MGVSRHRQAVPEGHDMICPYVGSRAFDIGNLKHRSKRAACHCWLANCWTFWVPIQVSGVAVQSLCTCPVAEFCMYLFVTQRPSRVASCRTRWQFNMAFICPDRGRLSPLHKSPGACIGQIVSRGFLLAIPFARFRQDCPLMRE